MDLPKDLQILISCYEPRFIILCGDCDWKLLLCRVFDCSFANVAAAELRALYIEKCEQKSIFGGEYHTLIKCDSGNIMGRGYDYASDGAWFGTISELSHDVNELVCGANYTIVRLANGKILSCGHNEYGQLGHGDVKSRLVFEEIKILPGDVKKIICGGVHTIIQLGDGRLFGCGSNTYGQLGLGDRENIVHFEEIMGLPEGV